MIKDSIGRWFKRIRLSLRGWRNNGLEVGYGIWRECDLFFYFEIEGF